MAKSWEVLNYLRPNGGLLQYGEDFEGIVFLEAEPFSKADYEAAFDLVDEAKVQAEAEAKAKREALLARLGITEEEAKILLG